MLQRPRRNRKNPFIRELLAENHLKSSDLVAIFFLLDGFNRKEDIPSMPGIFKFSLDILLKEIEEYEKLGCLAIALFPCFSDEKKASDANEALNPNNFYLKAIKAIKISFPHIQIIGDIALDPYSSEGHDGLINPKTGEIENDSTLQVLGEMAVLQAEAGVDIVAPSDMMDGRVAHIRKTLDQYQHTNINILSYTAKYASAFYGPFREALNSAPKKGDKKTYQMDFRNRREALLEALLDEKEGADILMVKPGLPYLDILVELRQKTVLPLTVYHVSGEYAMLKSSIEKGWVEKSAIIETHLAFKRAGADIIFSYFTKDILKHLKQQS